MESGATLAQLRPYDVIEPERDDAGPNPEPNEQPEPEDQAPKGPLLDLPDAEAAKYAEDLWKSQDAIIAPYAAQWEANKLRRKGRRDVHVIKDEDGQSGWRVYVPLLQVGTPSYPNRSDQTISEILSALLVDEPKPDCLPASDSDTDRDSAEFATRVLESETGESALNLREALYGAADLSATTGSGFLWWWTDPYGGGHEPQQVRAHPQAQRVEEAETGPMGAEPAPSADYVLRYMMPDGTLSQSSAGAVRTWRPKVCREWLNSHQVRFLPYLVGSLADAQGVMVARPTTWGQLVARYPDMAQMSPEDQTAMCGWSLGRDRLLYPDHMSRKRGDIKGKDGKIKADTPVLTLTVYYRACAEYPNGAYCVFAGGKFRLHGEEWSLEWTDEQGREHEDMRDIPLAQVRWKPDHASQNPYGIAVMDELGPLEELLATVDGGIQQLIYQALNPNVLVPIGTVIQPEAWGRRDGTMIPYNAAAGAPIVESAPNIPAYVFERSANLESRMDRVSGSAPSLRGLTSPNVTSGEQEKTLIEQALVMVSNLRHTMEDAYERSLRIILQEMKAGYTVPQMMRYLGEDGAFKYEEWTGADLGSTRDVRCRRGTFTMMAPSAKAAYIDQLVASQMLPLEKANRLKRGQVDSLIGQQDDPHYLRVKRQIRAWKDGPSDEAKAASEQYAANPPQPQVQGVGPDGQPMMAPPPPDPMYAAAAAIFAPIPVDDEPEAARTRWLELSEAMAGTSFATYPPPWQAAYIEAYNRARQAAGVTTLAEQQQMQQQAAQQQQQAAQQQAQMKAQDADAQHAREMQKLEVRAAQADDRDAKKLARDMERESMAAAAGAPPFVGN